MLRERKEVAGNGRQVLYTHEHRKQNGMILWRRFEWTPFTDIEKCVEEGLGGSILLLLRSQAAFSWA